MSLLRPLATILGLLAAWQALVWATGVPHFILPGPGRVAAALVAQPELLLRHAAITLQEILLGIALGSLIGAASAILLAASRTAQRWLMPLLVVSQALPVFALAPHPGALARLRHGLQGRDGRADHLLPGHRGLPRRAAAHRARLARAGPDHGCGAMGASCAISGCRRPCPP